MVHGIATIQLGCSYLSQNLFPWLPHRVQDQDDEFNTLGLGVLNDKPQTKTPGSELEVKPRPVLSCVNPLRASPVLLATFP